MPQSENFAPPFRLGDWLIQPDLNRMVGAEGPVQVEPRVMQVLLVLAERPGQVVTRNALLDQVWAEAIVGEEILTRAVSELRRIFGDKARTPNYIETIRNHGYRLIAEVTPVEAPAAAPESAPPVAPISDPEPAAPEAVPPTGTPAGRRIWLWPALALVVALAVWGSGLWRSDPPPPAGPVFSPTATAIPLTSFPGREWHPAPSSDGQRVAFVWAGLAGDNADIYIKQRNSESPLRLTSEPGWAAWPTWSPDNLTLIFVRQADQGTEICSVPSLGGAVRVLHTVDSWVEGLTWSPDGHHLLYSARGNGDGLFKLWRLSLTDMTAAVHPVPRPDNAGDFLPRYSPDGGALAWVGLDQAGSSRLLYRVADGPVRRLFDSPGGLRGLAFTPDGRELVFASDLGGVFNLYRMSLAGPPEPYLVATPGELAWNPAIAAGSGDLVYEQVRANRDIWQIRILGRDPWQLETSPLLQSTRWEYEAAFDPSGRQLAFVSARSGQPEIWIAEADGSGLRQLTFDGIPGVGNPRWSPDGRFLAYNTVPDGRSRAMLVEARGSQPRQLSDDGVPEIFSNWARDGQSLLVARDTGDGWQIHRRSLDGSDLGVLTTGGGLTAAESPQGNDLYFTRPGRAGLWRQALDSDPTGEPELVIPDLAGQDRFNWVVLPDRILWVMRTGGGALLSSYDRDTGWSLPLTDLPGLAGSGLAISPDQQVILYARTTESAGDLMLIPAGR